MKKIIILLCIIAVIVLAFWYWRHRAIPTTHYFSGYDASNEPVQNDSIMESSIERQVKKGILHIKPIAEYKITAKIMSKHGYRGDWSAEIAPYDYALAWGRLVEKQMKKYIKYTQYLRFYMYRYKFGTPVSQQYISEHSANTHVIPANQNLRNALYHTKKGQFITMEGFLVKVSGTVKGYPVTWNSSTTRKDTGNGACEIFYVTKLFHKNKIYE